MNPLLERLGGYPLAAYQDLKAELAADGRALYDFSIGDPVEPTPPVVRQALRDAVPEVSQYPTAAGIASLRAAIADWVRRRFGVQVDPDRHVLPTAGSKEGVFHLPLALMDPHGPRRHVVWGSPGYLPYERGQLFAGGESDPVVLRAPQGWRLGLDALEPARLERASHVWLNYPHNPTGAVADAGYLASSLETARGAGTVLCSDECYTDIWFDAPPPSLLQVLGDPAAPDLTGVLVAFSLSKRSGMTGYRSAALVGDPDLIVAQRLMRPNIGTASPEFVQRAAVVAWSDDEHVEQRRATFAAKRAVMAAFLRSAGLAVSGSEATFYLWVRVPGGDDAAYAEALLRQRVVVAPGRAFGAGGEGYVRLALVPSLAECEWAAEIWREALEAGALPGG